MKKTKFDLMKNDNLPEWDLNSLYKSLDDKKISQDIDKIKKDLIKFKKDFYDLKKLDNKDLSNMIKGYENITYNTYKLDLYSSLLFSKNSKDEKISALYVKINDFSANVNSDINFVSLKIANISENEIKNLLKDKEITKYKSWIENIRKYNNHRLSEDMESYIIEKNSATTSSIIKFYDQKLSSIKVDYKKNGINLSEAINLLQDKNRSTRMKISNSINEALKKNEFDFTFIFNTIFKSKNIDDKWEKFQDPMHKERISNNTKKETIDVLVKTVEDFFPRISHRYYKIKAKLLGLKKLHYSDRNAPIGKFSKSYNWNDALSIVSSAFSSISDLMSTEFDWFVNSNRIDSKIMPFKRGGAFCTTIEPFIFLNYGFNLDGVTTLAHEAGHAIQMKLSRDKYGILMSSAPLNTAEVPSTFAEYLVYKKILSNAKKKEEKIAILSKQIEHSINSIVRQISFHKMEEDMHNLRQKKEMTTQDISDIWIKRLKESLGKYVELDENIESYWPYISHFIHHPFYVHSYAFSDLITYALFSIKYKKTREEFERIYIDFFTNSSVETYDKLIEKIGFDATKKSFWAIGLEELEKLIDELENLL